MSSGQQRRHVIAGPLISRFIRSLPPLCAPAATRGGPRLTKFIGRSREMDAMKAAAERARSGHSQIVAAIAEPGVGLVSVAGPIPIRLAAMRSAFTPRARRRAFLDLLFGKVDVLDHGPSSSSALSFF